MPFAENWDILMKLFESGDKPGKKYHLSPNVNLKQVHVLVFCYGALSQIQDCQTVFLKRLILKKLLYIIC